MVELVVDVDVADDAILGSLLWFVGFVVNLLVCAVLVVDIKCDNKL